MRPPAARTAYAKRTVQNRRPLVLDRGQVELARELYASRRSTTAETPAG
jgi:hypothetical protein